jgi:hypothetical protein
VCEKFEKNYQKPILTAQIHQELKMAEIQENLSDVKN